MTREEMYQLAALPAEQRGAYADFENATQDTLEFLQPGQSNLIDVRTDTTPALARGTLLVR